MRNFISLILLIFSLLTACNPQKSERNTQTTEADTDTVAVQEEAPQNEVANKTDADETEAPNQFENQASSDLIQVETPQPNAKIQSPLTIKGKARGTWYFEADFPVLLKESDGNILAQTPAAAQGNWMTKDFVPFEATLEFETPDGEEGYLILQKANPSDNAENDGSYTIPVTF